MAESTDSEGNLPLCGGRVIHACSTNALSEQRLYLSIDVDTSSSFIGSSGQGDWSAVLALSQSVSVHANVGCVCTHTGGCTPPASTVVATTGS